mgnify:CR=1 FL=1
MTGEYGTIGHAGAESALDFHGNQIGLHSGDKRSDNWCNQRLLCILPATIALFVLLGPIMLVRIALEANPFSPFLCLGGHLRENR